MEVTLIIALAAAFAFVIFIRIMATQDHLFGRICRWWWNFSFKFSSHIPFMGWMAHFIIADTAEEIAQKEEYIKIGSSADGFAFDMIESAAERQRIEALKEEKIREHLAQKYGATNISINGDNTSATCTDRDGNSYDVHINWE